MLDDPPTSEGHHPKADQEQTGTTGLGNGHGRRWRNVIRPGVGQIDGVAIPDDRPCPGIRVARTAEAAGVDGKEAGFEPGDAPRGRGDGEGGDGVFRKVWHISSGVAGEQGDHINDEGTGSGADRQTAGDVEEIPVGPLGAGPIVDFPLVVTSAVPNGVARDREGAGAVARSQDAAGGDRHRTHRAGSLQDATVVDGHMTRGPSHIQSAAVVDRGRA